MENAAKALLIAGEVLIGIVILSILSMVFQRALTVNEAYKDRMQRQEVIQFNVEFQQYITKQDKKIYAQDVVTLINKVYDWNKDIGNNVITLVVLLPESNTIKVTRAIELTPTGTTNYSEKEFLTKYKLNKEYKFNCEMTFGGENGRVDTITVTCIEN